MIKPTWQERVKSVSETHANYVRTSWAKDQTQWTIEDTADVLHRSVGSVCEDIMIASFAKVYPKLFDFRTRIEAINFIKAKKLEHKMRGPE